MLSSHLARWHSSISNSQKSETGPYIKMAIKVQGQLGLQFKFQDSLGSIVRPRLKVKIGKRGKRREEKEERRGEKKREKGRGGKGGEGKGRKEEEEGRRRKEEKQRFWKMTHIHSGL